MEPTVCSVTHSFARMPPLRRSSGHQPQDLEISHGQRAVRSRFLSWSRALRGLQAAVDLNDLPIDGLAHQRSRSPPGECDVEIGPTAPAAKTASSRSSSIELVSTITAHIGACAALIWLISVAALSERSISSTSTTSGAGVEHRRKLSRPGVDVAEQLELAALARTKRHRLDEQGFVPDDEPLRPSLCPRDLHTHGPFRPTLEPLLRFGRYRSCLSREGCWTKG